MLDMLLCTILKEDMKLGGKSMIIYCHQALKQESLSHPSSSTSQWNTTTSRFHGGGIMFHIKDGTTICPKATWTQHCMHPKVILAQELAISLNSLTPPTLFLPSFLSLCLCLCLSLSLCFVLYFMYLQLDTLTKIPIRHNIGLCVPEKWTQLTFFFSFTCSPTAGTGTHRHSESHPFLSPSFLGRYLFVSHGYIIRHQQLADITAWFHANVYTSYFFFLFYCFPAWFCSQNG